MPASVIKRPPTISDRLRCLVRREIDAGSTLRSIAARAGLSPSRVCEFLQGKGCTLETAESLARAIGRPLRI
jgi:hypothetical protein